MKRGIVTSYPLEEDWGWFIEYQDGERELKICCLSEADDGEGYRGVPIARSIHVQAPGGMLERSKRSPEQVHAMAMLAQNLTAMIQEEGIEIRGLE